MAGKKFPAIISMLFVQNLFMRPLPDGGRTVGQYVKVEQASFFRPPAHLQVYSNFNSYR